MRAAPAVDAALDHGGPERMVITLLHAGAGAVLAAWALSHDATLSAAVAPAEFWPAVVGGASAMALLGWVLARRALPAHPARLRWDGQAWHLVQGSQPPIGNPQPLRRVVVSLDLGGWLLLHLLPVAAKAAGRAGRGEWRVASARRAGPAWHGLRVALLAHAGEAAPTPRRNDPTP